MSNSIAGVKIKEGSLIKFKGKHSMNVWYVRVDNFYDILESHGGGVGFNYTDLNGTGNGSIPAAMVQKVKTFNTIEEMQNEINANNRLIF